MNAEAGSGMRIWQRVWGIRRTRQGGNKCYTVMDELLTIRSLVPHRLCVPSCHAPPVPFVKTQVKRHQLINMDNTQTPSWAEYAEIQYIAGLWYCSSTGTWQVFVVCLGCFVFVFVWGGGSSKPGYFITNKSFLPVTGTFNLISISIY